MSFVITSTPPPPVRLGSDGKQLLQELAQMPSAPLITSVRSYQPHDPTDIWSAGRARVRAFGELIDSFCRLVPVSMVPMTTEGMFFLFNRLGYYEMFEPELEEEEHSDHMIVSATLKLTPKGERFAEMGGGLLFV